MIPVKKTQIYSILDLYRKSTDSERVCITWSSRGQPKILSDEAFEVKLKKHREDVGRSISEDDIKDILKQGLGEIADKRNESRMSVKSPSRKSVNNYFDYAKNRRPECFNKVEKVQQKSERRFSAERSIRGMLTYLISIACSHFTFRPKDPFIPDIDEATDGAKKLFELVRKQNEGLEICPVLPWFISTCDDTTLFCFEGESTNAKKSYLVDNEVDRNVQSAYTRDVTGNRKKKNMMFCK